jgi:hypothetical protein
MLQAVSHELGLQAVSIQTPSRSLLRRDLKTSYGSGYFPSGGGVEISCLIQDHADSRLTNVPSSTAIEEAERLVFPTSIGVWAERKTTSHRSKTAMALFVERS